MRALIHSLIAGFLLGISAIAHADDKSRCEALNAKGPSGSVQITASLVAPGFVLPKSIYPSTRLLHIGDDVNGTPAALSDKVSKAFCRIEGVAPTAIRFEVWMPLDGWNGRLLGLGNGAMAGAVPYPAIRAGVEAGYASVGSDLGHQGGFADSHFALGHPELLVDWGHRATHVMTQEARKAVAAFYGRLPAHAYFAGCSGGGRQAMMAAQRYPDDYDGILAGNPIINFTRLTMAGRLWAQLAMFRQDNGAGYIPAAKIPVISAGVNAACDMLDGVGDGIISDPRTCRFDPASIQCKAGDGPDCLTGPQVSALRQIYAGAHDSSGRKLFSGYSPGGELGPGGWASYHSGTAPYKSGLWAYAQGVLPILLYADPAWDMRLIDYDTDVDRALSLPILGKPMGEVIDAYDPDLSAFAARGGKLIHYHGWSDPGVPPLSSVAYYEDVVDRIAATERISQGDALARTRDSYRLFMVPGMQHCVGGPGPDVFDGLTPLRDWVEQGRAPDWIVAHRLTDDQIAMSRPLCPFPQVARWSGRGSTNEAAQFDCTSLGHSSLVVE